jgi:hypothetical protein
MYNGQRPHLYYGGESLKYYLTPPVVLLIKRVALTVLSTGTQSALKWKG